MMNSGDPWAGSGTSPSGWRARCRGVSALALAVQLVIGLLVVGGGRDDVTTSPQAVSDVGRATGAVAAPAVTAPVAQPIDTAVQGTGVGAVPVTDPAALSPDEDAARLVVPEPGQPAESRSHRAASASPPTTFQAAGPGSQSEQIFARQFPEHAAARQRDDVASSFHWAVIIGVNDYMGRTTSTIGSVGDAHVLRDTLYREGWRGDQVLTLTDHQATHDTIVRAIEWLIRSTDERSTVVFSFSGHMRHNAGVTALWPADNQFIWAGDLGRMLGAVRADRLWVSLQGCHAAGLAAPGLEGANRVVTYASRVEDKAYEDPASRLSVMGYHLLAEGLRDGRGRGSDGRVSVEKAFAWAASRATSRTQGQQPYGAQRPVLVDGLRGRAFAIAVTGAPATAGPPSAPLAPDDEASDPPSGLLEIPDIIPSLRRRD